MKPLTTTLTVLKTKMTSKILKPNNILIIAGETSGDTLGSHLVQAILKQQPSTNFIGFGGDKMQQAGVDIKMHCKDLAIIGIIEVIKKYKIIRRAFKIIKNIMNTKTIDLVVLIDYPGFNLRIAQQAHKRGIKVFYYTSPQIWAWKYRRIKIIKRCVNHMAVLFPFEEKIYQREQVPVTFVGHPLAAKAKSSMSKIDAREHFELDQDKPVIGIFPGSRHSEIKSLLPIIIDSTEQISAQIPGAQWLLPLAPNLDRDHIQDLLPQNIKITQDNIYNAMQACDIAIAVSGTITLELALLEVPSIIIYRTHSLTFMLAKCLVRTPYIGLCNIIAEQELAKELIQQHATAHNIANEVKFLLQNATHYNDLKEKLHNLRLKLGNIMDDQTIANLVLNELTTN